MVLIEIPYCISLLYHQVKLKLFKDHISKDAMVYLYDTVFVHCYFKISIIIAVLLD